jgi:hypothetical protein
MKKKRFLGVQHQLRAWFFVGLPILSVIATGFLPMPALLRQALIGVILIWFQISLMMGVF